jgi:hypothetical protein
MFKVNKRPINAFFKRLEKNMNQNKLTKLIQDLGNEVVLDSLIEVVERGYLMGFGWEKLESTIRKYKLDLEKGRLQIVGEISEDDWRRGLIKTGRFLLRVKEERANNKTQINGKKITYVLDVEQIEKDLSYLQYLRLSRDYYQALLNLIDERYGKSTIVDKIKHLLELITNIKFE